jgi:sulfur carrier protein ThiS adenylyltransferase
MSTSYRDRDIRQRELVPPQKLANIHAIVIGIGAVGRQVALQLAATGVPAMDLIDHDVVAVENLAPQGYWPQDIGIAKVEATGGLCQSINPDITLTHEFERFRRSSAKRLESLRGTGCKLAIFCCVDSIVTRKLIWESAKDRIHFFADGRMSAEVIRVLTSDRPAGDGYYETTLFGAEAAYAGSCTAKSTLYTASIAAGLMVGQFAKWLRDLPTDRDLTINLLSAELVAA